MKILKIKDYVLRKGDDGVICTDSSDTFTQEGLDTYETVSEKEFFDEINKDINRRLYEEGDYKLKFMDSFISCEFQLDRDSIILGNGYHYSRVPGYRMKGSDSAEISSHFRKIFNRY